MQSSRPDRPPGHDVPTLYTALHKFAAPDTFPLEPPHPFGAPSPLTDQLKDLMQTAEAMSLSLNTYLSQPWADPKLVSILRQHATVSHTLHQTDTTIRQAITALRTRAAHSRFGEDVPSDRAVLVDWCLGRLEVWGTAAGMEMFHDEPAEGHMTVLMGGKVLVVDVDLTVDRTDLMRPTIGVAAVKTSYAVPSAADGGGVASPNTNGSVSLAGFITDTLKAFLEAVQQEDAAENGMEVARRGKLVQEHLAYLMALDQLALSEGDSGLRWFTALDEMASVAEKFAKDETDAVSGALSVTQAPLDIFLNRSHTLPLPYLSSPSITFLTYISPITYLGLLRSTPATTEPSNLTLPRLDIPFGPLRTFLSSHPRPAGATVATLTLVSGDLTLLATNYSITGPWRPNFPLNGAGDQTDFVLPQVQMQPANPNSGAVTLAAPAPYTWVLDFTDGGARSGVVMSRPRMREMEMALRQLDTLDATSSQIGNGTWVDMLVNRDNPTISPERYTALYTSPSDAHPPLQLRLETPQEPGFVLERVPVRTLKEIWAVLEIVREQCWLNEMLTSLQWTTEGITRKDDMQQDEDAEATDDELQAILDGTFTPRRIPVNVSLTPGDMHDGHNPFYEDQALAQFTPRTTACIHMTSPERGPISGLVGILVSYQETQSRGVRVKVQGAVEMMGGDVTADTLEEVVRRGGIWGIPGRVWAAGRTL